jgi:hypothetical protein
MDPRQFIQTGVAAGVMAAKPGFTGTIRPGKRPNVLYMFDDEHRFQSMPGEPYSSSCSLWPMPQTPQREWTGEMKTPPYLR